MEPIGQMLVMAVLVLLYAVVVIGLVFTALYLVARIAGMARRALVRRLRP